MPTRQPSGEISVDIDPADLSRLLRDVREFDAELYKATRKRLRTAGQAGVKDVQRRVMTATFHSDTGLRRGLAAGTKVSIKTGIRSAGISITTTGVKLPEAKRVMVRAYNKQTFRHPTYGNREAWVSQRGRPYFGAVLDEKKPIMQRAMEEALRDAAATVAAGRVSTR